MRTILTPLLAWILVTASTAHSGEPEFRAFDGFDGKLALDWQPVRPDPAHVSLTKNAGQLTITTQLGGMFGDALSDPLLKGVQVRNLYLIGNPAPQGGDFVATTCIESFSPTIPYQQAGLLIYDDDDNYSKWGVECNGRTPSGLAFTFVAETNQTPQIRFVEAKRDARQYWLRFTKRGKQYQFARSYDGKEYTVVGETAWGNGTPKKIGLYAKNGGQPEATEVDARFDFLEVRSLNSVERNDPRYVDRRKLQGNWEVTSCRVSGKPLETMPFAQFVFTDERLLMAEKSRRMETEYRLDATKKPKQLVMSAFGGQLGGSVTAAYSVEGDTLVICFDPRPGASVPTELQTQEGDGRWLVTLKRVDEKDDKASDTSSPADSVGAKTQDASTAPQAKKPTTTRRTMRIHVVGPRGQAMPAAEIHASVWTKDPFQANRDYVCDAQGQAVVQLPQKIDILRIWARTDGHVPLFAQWWPEQQSDGHLIPQQFTFKLPKGTTIGGVIKNQDGQPIQGATVEVMRAIARPRVHTNQRPRLGTWLAEGGDGRITDAQGRWTLDNVPKGDEVQVRVKLSHPDYVNDYTWGGLQEEQNISMPSLRDQTATIVMRRGISVTGTVTDSEGKPISGAVVIWGEDPYLQTGSQEVRTDQQGVYRFPPLPPGPMTVTVVAEGWAPTLRQIDITPEMAPAHFQLTPGMTIRIRFIDRSGNSVPDVYVGINGWREGKSLYNHKHPNVVDTKIPRQADRYGVYQWTWAPDDVVQYSFGKEGYRSVRDVPLVADDRVHEITLSR